MLSRRLATTRFLMSFQEQVHSAPNGRHTRRRWRIAWLLGIGVLVNYFDRVNLSISQAALHHDFGIDTIVFGYLLGAYNWTYASLQLPIGVILDRFGVKRTGRVSIFLWSMASFASAVSRSIPAFFGARLLLGVGEAPTFPANAKAVGRWFPRAERSSATAIFDSAAKFASAIGVPILGIILLALGWRWSFALTGIISLLYLGYFWRVYRDPEDDVHLTAEERAYITADEVALEESAARSAPPLSLLTLTRQRKVLGVAIGNGSYNYVFYLLLTWLPSYLSTALHVDLLHSFLYTGFPWLFATICELSIGGWLTDRLIRRGYDASHVRQVVLVGGMACGLGIFGAAGAHTPLVALLWISLSIGGLSAAAPIGWSMPSLIAPRSSVGSVGGIFNFSNQLSAIVAPVLTGYVVAATHSFRWAFAVAAIYLVVGILAYLLLLGRIEPMFPEDGMGATSAQLPANGA